MKQIVYFDVSDGRMIFAIPREGMTYIGTTDTHFDQAKDEPGITVEDIDYLLGAANQMFHQYRYNETMFVRHGLDCGPLSLSLKKDLRNFHGKMKYLSLLQD